MKSEEIRKRFLTFFENRGHAIIPSASLVPEGDSSTLFTTAGMQPLVPYLLGQKHPKGKRLVNVQKSLRTGDIEEVGDKTHLTFFEMLGNWSLGDYFKREAIEWSYKLLTDEDEGFGLDPERLYITVFEGNNDAPRDDDSVEIWKQVGVPEHRIYYRGAEDNWWSPGDNGPCGPDTEMFYDITSEGLGDLSDQEFIRADEEQQVVEIWNDVFMEYEKKDGEVIGKLNQKNVDTGAGLERLAVILQGVGHVFETDLFTSAIGKIIEKSKKRNEKAEHIIADHMRAAVFAIGDGVEPTNTEGGYIVRRLIRRAARYARVVDMEDGGLSAVADEIVHQYAGVYEEIKMGHTDIVADIEREVQAFEATLSKGLKEFEKLSGNISGREAFDLYQTYGFPIEMTEELARERGVSIDRSGFDAELKKHQEASRTAAAGKFKGGLGDTSEETVKLHTAHHLLLAALQKVLGDEVKQRGSNITPERLRIDFSFDRKLTDDEKEKIEHQVNAWIDADLAVISKEMPKKQAEEIGAEMEFGAKYPDEVTVYFIEDEEGEVISKEFCGGPHVKQTGELGTFKIKKETSSSKGVRRIKAVLA